MGIDAESASTFPRASITRILASERPPSRWIRLRDVRVERFGFRGERGGDEPSLLHHRALLHIEQLPLETPHEREAGHRQKDQEDVEEQEAYG